MLAIPDILLILTFVVLLALVTLEKLEKAIAGILGGLVVFLIFFLTEDFFLLDVLEFIEFQVILTILGIFISVEVIGKSGFFQWLGIKGIKATKGHPYPLFILLCLVSSLLAGIITAIAVMIIIGNLTIDTSKVLDINPVPYLAAEAMTVNVGAFLTPIASIPNIIIQGEIEAVSFGFHAVNLMPFSLLLIPITVFLLLKYFKVLEEPVTERKTFLMEFSEWIVVSNRRLFYQTAILFSTMIASFVIIPNLLPQVELWLLAVLFMFLFLSLPEIEVEEVLSELDWELMFFLSGLFIMVEGLNHRGILLQVAQAMKSVVGSNYILSLLVVLWFSSLASGVIDDIAVTVVLIPIVLELIGPDSPLQAISVLIITTLIISVNIGGNLTPMASPTTVLAMSLSKKTTHELTPKAFFKIGFFITILQVSITTVYILFVLTFTHYYGVSMGILNIVILFVAGTLYLHLFSRRSFLSLFKAIRSRFSDFWVTMRDKWKELIGKEKKGKK